MRRPNWGLILAIAATLAFWGVVMSWAAPTVRQLTAISQQINHTRPARKADGSGNCLWIAAAKRQAFEQAGADAQIVLVSTRWGDRHALVLAEGLYFDSITQWPIPPERLAAMGYET